MEDTAPQTNRKPRGLHSVNRRFSRLFGVECTALRLLNFFEFNAAARQSVAQHLAQYQASDRTPAPDLDKPEQWAALAADMAGKSLAEKLTAAYDPARSLAERCAIFSFIDQAELTALAVQSAQGGAQTTTPTASPTAASAAPTAKRKPQSKHARRPRTQQTKRSV